MSATVAFVLVASSFSGAFASSPTVLQTAQTTYDFSSPTVQVNHFKMLDSTWTKTPDGFQTPANGGGRLFIPNNSDEYSITTTATLGKDWGSAAGTQGGYGIYFETSLSADNKDTGYVLQFDRGGNGLRLFNFINGIEQWGTYKSYTHSTDSVIPSTNTDPWWVQQHNVTLEVTRVPGTVDQKRLSAWIDGQKLSINYTFTSTLDPADSYTGLRAWSATTVFKSLSEIKYTYVPADSTAPTVTAAADRPANENGWFNGDVTVSFDASDEAGGSGVQSVDEPVLITTEGKSMPVIGYARDHAGNAGFITYLVSLDKTAPELSGKVVQTANKNGWYNGDVTVHFEASDSLSGLATVPADVWITGEGSDLSASATAVDQAGNRATAIVTGIKIDRSAPDISIGSSQISALGANEYLLNSDSSIGWSAQDAGSSGLATASSGNVKLDTGSVGTKTVSIEAVDNAGNKTTKQYSYKVIYGFSGVLQPINKDNSSIFKLGSTVPVKFQLKDALSANAGNGIATLSVSKLSSSIDGSVLETETLATASAGFQFRYDASSGQYSYNLSTKSLTAGTYKLTIKLDDGKSYSVSISSK